MKIRVTRLSYLIFVVWSLSACKASYQLNEDQYLLNKYIIEQQDKNVDRDELDGIIKQKPNRKILGFIPFYLYLNNWGHRGKETKFKIWLQNISEPPVIYDPMLIEKSTQQLELFIKKKGFYKGEVSDSVYFDEKHKKATVIYNIKGNTPYTIKKITFSIDDEDLLKPLKESARQTLLRPGANADEYLFTKERERMEKSMKNKGYYTFSKEFVYFEIDSNLKSNQINIKQIIQNPKLKVISKTNVDSLIDIKHQLYSINNIYITTFKAGDPAFLTNPDTVLFKDLNIISDGKQIYRPEVIEKNIFIKKGALYSLYNAEYTYKRLAGLRTFRIINIRFEETYGSQKSLDCYITVNAAEKKSVSIETEGTHRTGNLGIAANVVTRNKNTFKGAEVFEFKIKGGLEYQTLSDEEKANYDASSQNTIVERSPFNTIEYGAEMSLFIPEILKPGNKFDTPKYTEPKTNLNMAYNFQKRPFYDRNIFNISYKYFWRFGEYHRFSFHPIDLSFIEITKDSVFDRILSNLNNPLLSASYSDNFIPATRVSYIFNNQRHQTDHNHTFFRINIESAGNTLRLLSPTLNLDLSPEGYYRAFKVRFAQYAKVDIDLRRYQIITENSSTVYRIFGGVGVPLQNSTSLPFEKSFFAGGSNDQRAFTARTLGPGSLNDTLTFNTIDQIGDVAIGGNLEYRFNIFKSFEGAAFLDAGNIWLLKNDPKRPNGNFDFSRFYKELAIGAGLGARLNFGFFIIRFDAGIRLRDPALPEGERWFFESKDAYNAYYAEFLKNTDVAAYNRFIDKGYRTYRVKFNLGIGYPF